AAAVPLTPRQARIHRPRLPAAPAPADLLAGGQLTGRLASLPGACNRAGRVGWLAALGNTRMVAPGGQGGHVVEGLALEFLTGRGRVAALLPGHHPAEPLVECLKLAVVVGAVVAVPAGFQGHSAAFAGRCAGHDDVSPSDRSGPAGSGIVAGEAARSTRARSPAMSASAWPGGSPPAARASRFRLSTWRSRPSAS